MWEGPQTACAEWQCHFGSRLILVHQKNSTLHLVLRLRGGADHATYAGVGDFSTKLSSSTSQLVARTMDASKRKNFVLKVKATNGKMVSLVAKPSDTIASVKVQIQDTEGSWLVGWVVCL